MKCRTCGSEVPDSPPTLRPRERETLEHMARGASHADIARAMFISLNTAYQYTKRVRLFFGVTTCEEAVAKARLWDVLGEES